MHAFCLISAALNTRIEDLYDSLMESSTFEIHTRTANILIAKWNIGVVYIIFDEARDRRRARIFNCVPYSLPSGAFQGHENPRYNYDILTYKLLPSSSFINHVSCSFLFQPNG